MKIEKIETIRVRVRDDYYVDVTPSDSDTKFMDFKLCKIGCCDSVFMFGCEAKSEDEILNLIAGNVEDYISDFPGIDM